MAGERLPGPGICLGILRKNQQLSNIQRTWCWHRFSRLLSASSTRSTKVWIPATNASSINEWLASHAGCSISQRSHPQQESHRFYPRRRRNQPRYRYPQRTPGPRMNGWHRMRCARSISDHSYSIKVTIITIKTTRAGKRHRT